MSARQLCWPQAILFWDLFSPPNLRGDWPIVTKLCHMFREDPEKNPVRNLGPLSPKFGGPKTSKFRITSQLDRDYLRNATTSCQSENGVANYGHSHTMKANLLGVLWSINGENSTGVLTHPTGGHQAGHCQAFSSLRFPRCSARNVSSTKDPQSFRGSEIFCGSRSASAHHCWLRDTTKIFYNVEPSIHFTACCISTTAWVYITLPTLPIITFMT